MVVQRVAANPIVGIFPLYNDAVVRSAASVAFPSSTRRVSVFVPFVAFAVAAVVGLSLTPVITMVARRNGWLDYPDSQRRIHALPVPRLGGVGIFAGVVLSVVAFLLIPAFGGGLADWPLLPGLVVGSAIVFIVGLLDDLRGVPPIGKLAAQSAAALLAVWSGFAPDQIGILGLGTLDIGMWGYPIAVLWIVGVSNAFNLIDGVDGLAGAITLVALVGVLISGTLLGHPQVVLLAAALAGGTAAFLRYNSAPATIFLGDSGSLVIGYLIAVLTVQAATTSTGVVHAFVPLSVLAFPLLDTFIAMARRWLRGEPLSRADGRHVHHQVLALGLSPRHTVGVLTGIFATVAGIGLMLAFAPPQLVLLLAGLSLVFGVTGLAYGLRWLNYDEFIEAGRAVNQVYKKVRAILRARILASELGRDLAEAHDVEQLRKILSERAADLSLLDIELVLDDPRAHEASGIVPTATSQRPWRLDCPVVVPGHERPREDVLTLRIWSDRVRGASSVSPERIAARLVPAIEAWFSSHGTAANADDARDTASRKSGALSRRRRRSRG